MHAYPNVKARLAKLAQRPGFQKGLQVPSPYMFGDEAVTNPDAQDTYKTRRKYGGWLIKEALGEWEGKVVPLPSDHANLVRTSQLQLIFAFFPSL